MSSEDFGEKTIMACHASHCGAACLLKVYVKDGIITRVETDDGNEPQYRACARGRAIRQRVYAPDRVLYPMRRVGERGEGKFERITWEEAIDWLAGELKRVKENYGPASILFKHSGGDLTLLHGRMMPHLRLLNMFGGCSECWATHSYEGATFAQLATFGTRGTSSSRNNFNYSKLIIAWGWNPAESIHHTNTILYLKEAKDAGVPIISVGPRYTRTASLLADEWIPIIPGTDAAMLIAMAYVIIKNNLQDQAFLDRYTVGFEKYKDYVLGTEDGVAKTPDWAGKITGVPALTIEKLAKQYAAAKPAALMTGISPGRTAFGEQYHRAAITLAAMTANIGKVGGDAGASAFTGFGGQYGYMKVGPGITPVENPVEANLPPRKDSIPYNGVVRPVGWAGHVHLMEVGDAILKGKAGGYPADYKMMYMVNNDYPNQYQNINRLMTALRSKSLEFIMVAEQFMTPAAKVADLLLPVNTSLERNDVSYGSAIGFYGFLAKTIESIGESKSHFEICELLAAKLGINDFADNKDEASWLKQIASRMPIPDYDQFRKDGIVKAKLDKPWACFEAEVSDPENTKFPTPTGKIEIYSQRLADMNNPLIPAIPKYIETWESRNDPLASKYPLQLVTTHFWRRAHSQYDNLPWLREIEPQRMGINPADAKHRGIKNGDMTRVFNDRGVVLIMAKVTETVMPGVVDIPQGAWYDPDQNGVDRGGSCNVLTKDQRSPGGAYVTNTSLVQVAKV